MSSGGEPVQGGGSVKTLWEKIRAWPIWVKITALAGIVSVAANIATVVDRGGSVWSRMSGPALSVQAETSDFRLPDAVRGHFEGLASVDARDRPAVVKESLGPSRDENKGMAEWQEHILRARSVIELMDSPARTLGEIRGTMVFSISNTGDNPAADVALQCNHSGFAEIKRLNQATELLTFDKRLELGEIKVAEPLSVTVWTKSLAVNPDEPVLLTHKVGKQEVFFRNDAKPRTSNIMHIVTAAMFLFMAWQLYQLTFNRRTIQLQVLEYTWEQVRTKFREAYDISLPLLTDNDRAKFHKLVADAKNEREQAGHES